MVYFSVRKKGKKMSFSYHHKNSTVQFENFRIGVFHFNKDKKENMTIQRLMTILSYGGKPTKPSGITAVRWNAMIKMAQKTLGKV